MFKRLAFLLVCSIHVLAQAPAALPDPLANVSCSTFHWASARGQSKAAILVPIKLNGKEYTYQLDTGADVVLVYGKAAHPEWAARGDGMRIPNVVFAGLTLSSILAYPRHDMPDGSTAGTVGLGLFVGKTFVIDFPHTRVCLLERADLSSDLIARATWTPAEVRHGKFFLDTILNGLPLTDVLYDSGSSSDALALDTARWQQATGVTNPAAAPIQRKATSWSKEIKIAGAPSTGSLQLGKMEFHRPTVTSVLSRPTDLHDKYSANGLLGNALFLDSIVMLDLGVHPRMGLLKP